MMDELKSKQDYWVKLHWVISQFTFLFNGLAQLIMYGCQMGTNSLRHEFCNNVQSKPSWSAKHITDVFVLGEALLL